MGSILTETFKASTGILSVGVVNWSDEFGSTEFIISDLFPDAQWVVDLHGLTWYKGGRPAILSTGMSLEHDLSKLLAKETGLPLITRPLSLSNDSFCTNRVSREDRMGSEEAVYPSLVILDLKSLDEESSIYGRGEAIGLYYSYREYVSLRGGRLGDLKPFLEMWKILDERGLLGIASALIWKCLVMRVNGDHTIGAGSDHLLAYALSDLNCFKRHGTGVMAGSILMSSLTEWDLGPYNLKDLVRASVRWGLLKKECLELLLEMFTEDLLNKALMTRPRRPSLLRSIYGLREARYSLESAIRDLSCISI